MNRHTFPTGFNIGSSQADVWTPSNLEFESKHQIYIHSNEVPTGPNMARRVFTLGVAIPFQLLHFPFQKRSSQEICFTEHWRQLYYHSCHLRLNRNRKSQWPNIWQRCWMWEKARSLPNGIQISTPKKKNFWSEGSIHSLSSRAQFYVHEYFRVAGTAYANKTCGSAPSPIQANHHYCCLKRERKKYEKKISFVIGKLREKKKDIDTAFTPKTRASLFMRSIFWSWMTLRDGRGSPVPKLEKRCRPCQDPTGGDCHHWPALCVWTRPGIVAKDISPPLRQWSPAGLAKSRCYLNWRSVREWARLWRPASAV